MGLVSVALGFAPGFLAGKTFLSVLKLESVVLEVLFSNFDGFLQLADEVFKLVLAALKTVVFFG